ncbi:MAG: FtsK/SpoIIIE domain-containing protein [Gaiellaceae bacterium]
MARVGAAGRIVPPWSLPEKLLALLRDRAGGLWRWREFTIPLGLLSVVYAEGGDAAVLAVVVLLVGAAALVLLVRSALIVGATRRCLMRTRTFVRRRRWPRICMGLRWYRKLDEGAVLIPELLSWNEDDGRVTVELRPLPEQPAGSWDAMADALRRFLGGASVEWRESFGTLRVVVGRVGLPDFLPWHAYGAPEGRLVLGRRHGGEPLVLDARTTPHVLLSGATGSGKGGAIRVTAAAALQGGWHLVVLDPKEAGEFTWLDLLDVPVVTALREQVETLEHLTSVRRARQEVVRSHGADTWLDLPGDVLQIWRPVLLIVDEAADLLAATKGKSGEDRLRSTLQHKAGELISELARKGRSAGIHLVVAIQRPETAQLGDQGGSLRNNLTARLALGSLDADGLRMLGISATDPVALALDGTPGRGICVGFAGDPRPSVCQVAWLDQARACAEVMPTDLQGLHLIQPSAAVDERAST